MKTRRLADFQPRRLTQARAMKMLNMSELAERAGLTRQAISQYEKGDAAPAPEKLRTLAEVLQVDARFLTIPASGIEAERESPITFRTLASSTNRARLQARTFLEWMALIINVLSRHVALPPVRLPNFEIGDFSELSESDIEDIASETRKAMGLGDGPISNLTLLLENHGVIVGRAPLHEKLDGLCAWFADRPFAIINSKAKAVRWRYDLAHELGHMILHRSLASDEELNDKALLNLIEKQAFRFGGAFLLPDSTFGAEVYGLDLHSLTELKKRWLVSMAAMTMRLTDIGVISGSQKTRIFQYTLRNYRRHEPLDSELLREDPRLFSRIFELLATENVVTAQELVGNMGLPQDAIAQIAALPESLLVPRDLPDNVISLRR